MEMTQVMNQKFLLLGIGINVNQENWESEPKATSLRKLKGELLEVADVMDAILLSIDDIWKNMRDLKLDYRQALWNMGEEVLLDIQSNEKMEKHEFAEINEIGGEQIRGIFHEVDEEGRIVVSMENGTMLRFHHGQVRLKF
jgi:biotin-(acetyl-CoA carboxylase) ligase